MKNNNINISNYELFFVDYLEGNLSANEEQMLLDFLEENPYLREEFNLILNSKLEPTCLAFNNKEGLKKPHFSKNGISNEIDYLCIASIENDISKNEQINLNSLVSGNDDNSKTLSIFLKTKLEPNRNIEFAHKQSLKRFTIFGYSQRAAKFATGVAAGFLLLIGSYSVVKFYLVEKEVQLATNSPIENAGKAGLHIINKENINSALPQHNTYNVIPKDNAKLENDSNAFAEDTLKTTAYNEAPPTQAETFIKPIEALELIASSDLSNMKAVAEISALTKSDIVSSAEIFSHNRSKKEVGLFEIAQLGVSKLASFTDSDLSLNAKKNDNGKITRISFESSLFAFSTPIRKNSK